MIEPEHDSDGLGGLASMPRLLVIGYGNSLRGDDGIGRRIAAEVERWQVPGVATRSVHLLVPELVEDIKCAPCVLFVDAAARSAEVHLRRIDGNLGRPALNHTCEPGGLLALVNGLYGRRPVGWLLTVPGSHFGMGEELSPIGQGNMTKALTQVRAFCQSIEITSVTVE